ncbi:MAG: oxygenase MpaB family protein [Vicinamibacterales bacterium]
MTRPRRGGITWTIMGERVALLAWPRAILLQIAHPLVAAGVHAHSGFRDSALAPFSRLRATTRAMRHLTFGDDEAAMRAVERITGVHDRVHGALAGRRLAAYPTGTPYSAHDPDSSCCGSTPRLDSHVILERVLRPFTDAERDAYCQEAVAFAVCRCSAHGLTRSPPTWARLQRTWLPRRQRTRAGRRRGTRARPRRAPPHALAGSCIARPAAETVSTYSLPASIRAGARIRLSRGRAPDGARCAGRAARARTRPPGALARSAEDLTPRA